jgi:hypothetical protein
MGTHQVAKPHMISAIILGWVLIALVYLIFSFLAGNYMVYTPLLVIYAAWTVVSLVIFGRGLDREMAESEHAH